MIAIRSARIPASLLFVWTFVFALKSPGAMSRGGLSVEALLNFTTEQIYRNGSQSTNDQVFNAHLGLDYQLSDVFFIGARDWLINQTGLGGYKVTGNAYGPELGFQVDNFLFDFVYFLGGTRTIHNGSDENYSSASGWQFGFGYCFQTGSSLVWGPMLTYTDIKYGNSSPNNGTYEWVALEPYLVLKFSI